MESMAEAVTSFAVETLGKLLIEEVKFLSEVSDQVRDVKDELIRMKCFLKDVDLKRHTGESVRNYAREIKNLAYQIEDVVEEFVIRVESRNGSGSIQRIVKKLACLVCECADLHKAGSEITNIQKKITILEKRSETYGIKPLLSRGQNSSTADDENQHFIRQTFPHETDEHFVGMEKDIGELLPLILDHNNPNRSKSHPVVSIWGMGGLGKTTLAKKIYHHREVKDSFQAFAWICITQQCRPRSMMQDLLGQLVPERKNQVKDLGDRDLVQQLYEVQEQKECFIVLDDVWEIDHWRSLSHCFLRANASSKVLLTTRKEDVAEIGYPHELKCLTEDEGWQLLWRKSFAGVHDEVVIQVYHLMIPKLLKTWVEQWFVNVDLCH